MNNTDTRQPWGWFLGLAAALLVILLLCVWCAPSQGQGWGTGTGAGRSPLLTATPKYEWRVVPGTEGDQEALLADGKQVGVWCYSRACYLPLNPDGTWGKPTNKTPDGYTTTPAKPEKKQDECTGSCPCKKCEDGCECQKAGKPCSQECPCAAGKLASGKPPEQGKTQPAVENKAREENFPTGVDREKWTQTAGRKYKFHNGQKCVPVSPAQAHRMAESSVEEGIPDDSTKLRLVIIGQEADRKRVLADTEALSEKVKDRLIVQTYQADSPLVKQRRLVSDGQPTVYLMAPDGIVLGRNRDGKWDTGKVRVIEQKVNDYDPSKDPDLVPKPDPAKPDPVAPKPFTPQDVPWYVWMGGAGLVLFVLLRNKAPQN